MFIIHLIVLCLFALPICDNSNVYGSDPTKLPAWFWDSPVIPNVHFSVGYSRPHRDSPTAFDEAFSEGSLRLFGDKIGVNIVGETASVSTPRGMRIVYNTMEIVVDTVGFTNFQYSLFRLDSVSTLEFRAILIADADIVVKKDLIESPLIDENSYFQAGIEQEFFHFSSSWIGAERQARIEYSLGVAVSVKSLTKTWNEVMRNYTVNSVDKNIIGLQTYSRRYDSERNIFIVQVKAK